MLYDLSYQRERALKRTRESLEEMENVLREMSPDSPHRMLIVNLLKSLRSAEARLASGLPADRRVLSK